MVCSLLRADCGLLMRGRLLILMLGPLIIALSFGLALLISRSCSGFRLGVLLGILGGSLASRALYTPLSILFFESRYLVY